MARDWKTVYNPTQSTNQHDLAFDETAVAGHRVVAVCSAAALVGIDSAGWTEHVSSVLSVEAIGASLVADGGETQLQVTLGPGGAARALAGWLESRDDLDAPHGDPVTAEGTVSGGAFTIGSITTSAANCRLYAAVAQALPSEEWTPVWPAPLTGEDVVYATPGSPSGSDEDIRLGVASGLAVEPGTYSVTVTGLPTGASVQGVLFAFTTADSELPPPENRIEEENRLAGASQAEWDVAGAGSATIQGFPTQMSVEAGQPLGLKVHSPSSDWTATVYRLGWYAGLGARQVATFAGGQTSQPAGTVDGTTGMASCANWATNGTWAVPADACPGVYLIKIARTDNTALASHVGPFVVRDPSRTAPLVVKTSDSTWQAYNHAGADPDNLFTGTNVYGDGDAAEFRWDLVTGLDVRADAVSYDRPLVTRLHLPQTSIWNAEYPLIRWLERCGYDLDYVSTLDVDADPTLLLGRAVAVSSGHDEYWSSRVWQAYAAARDTGTHLVFLSGNEAFWRINPTGAGARTYACWKDTHDGTLNPTGVYSGTWQDTRGFNPDRRPPALLNGQRFRLNGISAYPVQADASHAAIPFWRDTAVAALAGEDVWESSGHIVGFEGDEPADADPDETPATLLRMSSMTASVTGLLADDDGDTYDNTGTYTHAFTLYPASSGALVFGAGTVQYAWALDDVHDRHPGGTLADSTLRQALLNLLADMGVQPVTVPAGLTDPTPATAADYGFPEIEDNMTFADAAANAGMDAIATLITHISAHDAVPDGAGSDEIAGGSYARVAASWGSAASRVVASDAQVDINIPTGTTVYARGYWTASTDGTYLGHSLVGNTRRGFGTVDSAGITSDAIQSAGHGLSNGNRVVLYPVFGESLPAGFAARTVYWVVSATTDTFELSETEGGASVNVTGQGELMWADCIPITYEVDGVLTANSGQLTLSGAAI